MGPASFTRATLCRAQLQGPDPTAFDQVLSNQNAALAYIMMKAGGSVGGECSQNSWCSQNSIPAASSAARVFVNMTSEADANRNLKDIHKFDDEYEVELVARCCRWDPQEPIVTSAHGDEN